MKKGILILLTAFIATLFWACDDTLSVIGSGLSQNDVAINIDTTFTVTGRTVRVTDIRPKTTNQLLGAIEIPGFGYLGSDAVCQFLPPVELDTADFNYTDVDSVFLTLGYARGAFMGDSVAPIGLTVYPLTQQINSQITSAFNPVGYYDPKPIGSLVFNTSTRNDSVAMKQSSRTVKVKLPAELGRKIFKAFQDNPANFANGQVFAKNVFPGLYIKRTFGSGRMTVFSSTSLSFHMRSIKPTSVEGKNDTVMAVHEYGLVTPEVVNNNILTYRMASSLQADIAAGKHMLIAPAGCEMELDFPTPAIIEKYQKGKNVNTVLNTLTMSIPVDTIANDLGVVPPPYLLLVLKKDRDEFFAKNKLCDNKTSFYAKYDEASRSYIFSTMRSYLLDMLAKESITAEDYTFSLVPVQVNFEQLVNTSYYSSSVQYTESEILPYILTPAMAEVRLDKVKIRLTYTTLK